MTKITSSTDEKFNRATVYQFYYASHAIITFLSPGMTTGWSAVALPLMSSNETSLRSDAIFYGNEIAATWFASLVGFTGPFSCILNIFFMRIGRKIPMAIVGYTCAAGWLIIATSYGIPQIMIGRFIAGIGAGLSTAPAIVYITEISTPKYRLGLVNGASLCVAVGIMLVYVLGYFIESWRMQALICTVIPLISASGILLLVPESPVWLLHKNSESQARKSLMKLRGAKVLTAELEIEFSELTSNAEKNKRVEMASAEARYKMARAAAILDRLASFFRTLALPEVWKPFFLLNSLFFFLQFCGYTVILAYSVDFLKNCGLSMDAFLITAGLGLIQMIGCIVLVSTSRRLGVRQMSLVSTIGMSTSFGILAIYLQFVAPSDPDQKYQPLAIICLFTFMATGSYGITAVPWSMIGEVYPTNHVHFLAPLTTCICDIFNYTTTQLYPLLRDRGFISTIYFYCSVSIIATLFVIFLLPETRGIPHHEIINRFKNTGGLCPKKQNISINTINTIH